MEPVIYKIKSENPADRAAIARDILESVGSRFARVDFRKADGSFRRMVIHPAKGYAEARKPPPPSESARKAAITRAINHPNLWNVWDNLAEGWRSVNLDTIEAIRHNKVLYLFK